jgi:hypothetical protein
VCVGDKQQLFNFLVENSVEVLNQVIIELLVFQADLTLAENM